MLNEHITRSVRRLSEPAYASQQVWQPKDYDWPADWEGRCLLAQSCLNQISDLENPFAHTIVQDLPGHCNEEGFMGAVFNPHAVDEQQLSGHGWLLRGLMTYHRVYQDTLSIQLATNIVNGLFLPMGKHIKDYPIYRSKTNAGAVSGESNQIINCWKVSTDIGCIFIGMDGLADYYIERPSEEIKTLLIDLVNLYCKIDKVQIRAQTHATLTGARAIMRLYKATKNAQYLTIVKNAFDTYIQHGMTATYENFNWYGREDTWTEPCAIVDSFLLALQLFEETKEAVYLQYARRIWFNGLSFCHRDNGGAGPNTCVTTANPVLKVSYMEAAFCCTMRYCEGLLYARKYETLLFHNPNKEVKIEADGRAYIDDVLLVKKQDGSIALITELLATQENIDDAYLVYWNA